MFHPTPDELLLAVLILTAIRTGLEVLRFAIELIRRR